ncbi:MAG: carboxylate-amine ligase [Alphaproteobacteria bacterium]
MSVPPEPTLTLGIEEEYLLVDQQTRDLVREQPAGLMDACTKELGDRVTVELLQSQIEVGTDVCTSVGEARAELENMRRCIADVADQFGLAPIAASTHPFAKWSDQVHTHKDRYHDLIRDLGATAQRMVICGMHVHAGIEDQDLRIDLMNQVSYFLPHLLALSTSSPFWQGTDMELMSYRTVIFSSLPRTGLPERFGSWSEYQRFVGQLISAGVIDEPTKIWWDVRPSGRFPTLEMRAADMCTRIEDTASVAAMYQCLLRYLYRLRRDNQIWRRYPLPLIDENRWRAMRYGADGSLIDFGKGETVAFAHLVDEMIYELREDADALDCRAELEHAREIVRRGTGAQRQLHVHSAAIAAGADEEEALRDVVDDLIIQTLDFEDSTHTSA